MAELFTPAEIDMIVELFEKEIANSKLWFKFYAKRKASIPEALATEKYMNSCIRIVNKLKN